MIIWKKRASRVTVTAAILLMTAGFLHSLYYVIGLAGGWERDLWNIIQVVAGLGAAALGYWIWKWRSRRFTARGRAYLRTAQAVIGLGLVFFVMMEGWIWLSGRPADMQQSDVLLILGARVKGENVSLSLKDRLDEGLAYLNKYPDTLILLSGGQGEGEDITEAEAMKRYLTANGIQAERILKEESSTSTYENLTYSRKLLKEQGMDVTTTRITLVTNDFHMLRSKWLAGRVGLHVYGLPAATPPYTVPRMLTREFAAILKSFLFDR